jgi:uncharacterized cupin superfamily protein
MLRCEQLRGRTADESRAVPWGVLIESSPSEEIVMSFKLAHRDDCETAGNWQLVRRTLELRAFGINVVEIPPGEQIPEHDEVDRDQEEVFYVLTGRPTLLIDGKSHPTRAGTFARLDPEHSRTVRNDGDGPASVLIVSAPRASGYEPMAWA